MRRLHRHQWRPKELINGSLYGAVCSVCGKDRKFPTWKYKYFRLIYVDHGGFDDWLFGLSLYRTGSRHGSGPQLGVMFGHREAIFALPHRLQAWLPRAPENW